MTFRRLTLGLLLAIPMAHASPRTQIEYRFVQSDTLMHPEIAGVERGLFFRLPVPAAEYPGDLIEAAPMNMRALTPITVRYLSRHNYPIYRFWTWIGMFLTALPLAAVGGIVLSRMRERFHAIR